MAKALKLNDLQLILLSTASQRDDGNLLPPPDAAGPDVERVRKTIQALLKRNLVAETTTNQIDCIWREQDDQRLTVVITDAGRMAIGAGGEPETADGPKTSEPPAQGESPPAAKRGPRSGSKKALLLDMLKRPEGAALTDLTEATGWLPHTTRAAITGVRKAGHRVITSKVEGVTRYRIEAAE